MSTVVKTTVPVLPFTLITLAPSAAVLALIVPFAVSYTIVLSNALIAALALALVKYKFVPSTTLLVVKSTILAFSARFPVTAA